MSRSLALAALALLALPACDSDPVEDDGGVITERAAGVPHVGSFAVVLGKAAYVGNAGNFAENNGSVTRYVLASGDVSTPLPADSLGGLVQNLAVEGTDLFVLLNFSDSFDTGRGRVDVFGLGLGERRRQDDVSVPRGFGVAERTPVSDGTTVATAYWTTNLYAGTATRLSDDGAELTVAVGASPEGLTVVDDRVYVANSGFGFGRSLSVIDRTTPVLFIDTEMLFAETLDYQHELTERLHLKNVKVIRASDEMKKLHDPDGTLHQYNTDACCDLRKTIPLQNALNDYDAWITGRKRYQSSTRAALDFFENEDDTRIKINPLCHWDMSDLQDYMTENRLPRHPLVAKGYPSIGCAPCTSPVKEGEDPRAGRWRNSNKEECGIHFVNGKVVRGGGVAA